MVIEFGGKCMNPKCGCTHNLQFAHNGETPLSGHGSGRGSYRRIIDVLINWKKYLLLCKDCHILFDNKELKI